MSLFKNPAHLSRELRTSLQTFLTGEVSSYFYGEKYGDRNETEIMEDRHILTKNRYKNILELRKVKCKYLLDKLPHIVKNYYFVTYEQLASSPIKILEEIKNKFNLELTKSCISVDMTTDYKHVGQKFVKKIYIVPPDQQRQIDKGLDWALEARMGYKKKLKM